MKILHVFIIIINHIKFNEASNFSIKFDFN